MTKCDFCTMYDPIKGCWWMSITARQNDCEEAINRMVEALKKVGTKK